MQIKPQGWILILITLYTLVFFFIFEGNTLTLTGAFVGLFYWLFLSVAFSSIGMLLGYVMLIAIHDEEKRYEYQVYIGAIFLLIGTLIVLFMPDHPRRLFDMTIKSRLTISVSILGAFAWGVYYLLKWEKTNSQK
ncbi:hypothetical protein ACFL6F_01065 [Planctomycetota bacterium]